MPSLVSKEVTNFIKAEMAKIDDELWELQQSIWKNPETAYEEKFAHDTLTKFMSSQAGWDVTKHTFGVETSFLCVFKHKSEENSTMISFNSEYDALPNVGHACGHNLIAVCGVSAALSTAIAMKQFDIAGTVKLIGTPAEEGGGGKIKLIEAGAFKDVDVSLMAHPFNDKTKAYFFSNANQRFYVEFFGKEAHAAASPWQGINALDAMVILYNAVSVLRQQLLPTDIVQCNISDGGQAPNIITGHSKALFAVRAPNLGRLKELQAKVENCAMAGALATGCKVKITPYTNYYNMVSNEVMAESFGKYMNDVFDYKMETIDEEKRGGKAGGSTDEGNVSWVVPSIHPMFEIESPEGGPHTKVFAASAGKKSAHVSALKTGMTLAFVGLELLLSKEKLASVKRAWELDMVEQKKHMSFSTETIDTLDQLIYKE